MGSGHSYLMEMPVAAPAPVAPVAPVAMSLQELYNKCKHGKASLEEEPNYMLQDLYHKHRFFLSVLTQMLFDDI